MKICNQTKMLVLNVKQGSEISYDASCRNLKIPKRDCSGEKVHCYVLQMPPNVCLFDYSSISVHWLQVVTESYIKIKGAFEKMKKFAVIFLQYR